MVAQPIDRDEVERTFLKMLPELRSRSYAANQGLNRTEREEAVQEACCFAWVQLLSASRRNRLGNPTAYTLARFAWLAFRSGRRFAGGCSVNDVMSEAAQSSGKVAACSLDAHHADGDDGREERGFAILRPLRTPKPPDICRVNCDYSLLLQDPSLSRRAKDVFRRLVTDHDRGCCSRIARELKVSPPYIHELKEKLKEKLTQIGYAP